MSHIKYTSGTVVQHFDDEGICTDQYFNAGDQVEYVDAETCITINAPDVGEFAPFDMVQPFDNIIQQVTYA